LKKYDSVFLCLLDPESSQRKETAAVLKEGVKFARELSALSTGVLVVDPSRDEEEYLVRSIYAQMGRPPVGGQPVVALVCASGRVADVTVGVPSLEQVIDRLQRIYHEGGILDPSRFGEDLLMVW